jgi:hypothetical protein
MATDVTVDVRTDGLKTSGATSLAWNATITGGLTNSVLVGCGTTGAGTARRITTFAWDAAGTPVAMTNLGFIEEPGLNCYAEIWLLKAPASGTKQVKITPAASCEITGGSASYQWVNQTTPWNAGSPQTATHSGGGATSSSLSVTSALRTSADLCSSMAVAALPPRAAPFSRAVRASQNLDGDSSRCLASIACPIRVLSRPPVAMRT